jgi:hypothetical protein
MNSLASRRPDRELAAGKNYLCGASSFRLADYTGGLPCRGVRGQSAGGTPDHPFRASRWSGVQQTNCPAAWMVGAKTSMDSESVLCRNRLLERLRSGGSLGCQALAKVNGRAVAFKGTVPLSPSWECRCRTQFDTCSFSLIDLAWFSTAKSKSSP